MSESAYSSLQTPRSSRITSTRRPPHPSIPMLGLRSSLFPLVTKCQPQPTAAGSGTNSIAPATLSQPLPFAVAFSGSRAKVLSRVGLPYRVGRRIWARCGEKDVLKMLLHCSFEFLRPKDHVFTFAHSREHPFAIVGLNSKQFATSGHPSQYDD